MYDKVLPQLQFRVLRLLVGAADRKINLAGPMIRDQLADDGKKRSYPAFYQLMGRLEQAGLVRGYVDEEQLGPHNFPQKFYAVTDEGRRIYKLSEAYYERLQQTRGVLEEIRLAMGGSL